MLYQLSYIPTSVLIIGSNPGKVNLLRHKTLHQVLSKTQILAIVGLTLVTSTVISYALKSKDPERVPLVPPQRFRAWWMLVAGLVMAHVLGSNPKLGPIPQLLGFAMLSVLATRQFLTHLKNEPTRHTKVVCYLSAVLQYCWIYIHWYGFFVVFVPVFLFLYLPVSGSFREEADSPLLETASLHWVMMTAVFCLSHAAYLLILPGGKGLLFFVVLLTEVADAARMLLAPNPIGKKYSPLLSCLTAVTVAWVVGPAFTPLSQEHTLLAGLVLGVAGSIGHANISKLSEEMNIQRGGALERIESLAYTAPIFLHGYRYFDYPFTG